MKVKTSITLPDTLIAQIDREDSNRSHFLELAAHQRLKALEESRREARDAAILEKHSERLNREALDVLSYQGDVLGYQEKD